MKGKGRENPVIKPLMSCSPEEKLKTPRIEQTNVPKTMPRFEVRNPREGIESQKAPPQYRYATELMQNTDQEKVFQKLLDQPVTLKLSKVLGSLFELSQQFQMATKSQEVISERDEDSDDEKEEEDTDVEETYQFCVNSGEASPSLPSIEESHDLTYQSMLQEEFEQQNMNSV